MTLAQALEKKHMKKIIFIILPEINISVDALCLHLRDVMENKEPEKE